MILQIKMIDQVSEPASARVYNSVRSKEEANNLILSFIFFALAFVVPSKLKVPFDECQYHNCGVRGRNYRFLSESARIGLVFNSPRQMIFVFISSFFILRILRRRSKSYQAGNHLSLQCSALERIFCGALRRAKL